MTKCKLLKALTAVAASLATAGVLAQPNILFIAIDDLVPTIGAYGDPIAKTPAIDSLASQGTTFLNHHVQWPVCGPSRAALTTGLLPEETGVMGFRPIRAILPDVVTLPQHFRNNGYETAATGKFHDPRTVGTITDPNSSTEDGRTIDDPASWSIPYRVAASGYNPSGKPAVDFSDRPESEYVDYKIMEEGKNLLDTLEDGNKPFFLAVGFKKPHLPFVAPLKYWELYERERFATATFQNLPLNASPVLQDSLGDNGELLGYAPYSATGLPTPEQQKELIHGYYACTSFIDALVAELLQHLASLQDPVKPQLKMSETTIVVIWGDHGFHLGDHGKWAKHTVMERATAAPLIIFDPSQPVQSNRSTAPVNTVDLFPTLCELATLPIPSQPISDSTSTGRPLRGRSIVPLLKDPTTEVNSGALSYIRRNSVIGYAFRTERYRYIEWINSSYQITARDLYDYKLDSFETRNLVSDPVYASIVYQLSRAMRAEPIAKGASRLINSAPIAASGEDIELGLGYVPIETISLVSTTSTDAVELTCDAFRGVTYDILKSHDLTYPNWTPAQAGKSGRHHLVEMSAASEFYRIRLGNNIPPAFLSDPLLLPSGSPGIPYDISLADFLIQNDPDDTYNYTKLDGPNWIRVDADGSLAGTPPQDTLGSLYFRLTVHDADGASETVLANLNIQL